MPFRFRREEAQAAGTRRESTETLEPQPPLYRSPTLRALLSRLDGDTPHRILDLQPAVGANVEFFSRYSCRLQIVDVLGALADGEARSQLDSDPAAAFRRVLPSPEEPYDVVLAWEVPNYLDHDQLLRLFERLRGISRAGALMLLFVATGKEIPLLPALLKIVDEQTLHWQPRTPAVRPGPRLPPAEVEHMAGGFAVVHSVVMRHGVREYLFERLHDRDDLP